MAKTVHNLTFYRSTPSHGAQYSDQRESSTPVNFANTILPRSQSSNNGYHGNSSSSGHYGARGRGGGHGGRYQDGEMSAARHLRQQISQNHGYGHGQGRHRDVPVFTASAAAAAAVQLQQHLPPTDRQEFSEPSTVIWCEGGIGEVMSPTVWRNHNLHLYFDESKTVMEGQGGWGGLKTELEPGMEMDITFSISNGLLDQLQSLQMESASNSADTHTFVRIASIAELRVSRSASMRTHEQAVVIAKRSGGATFLINNSGERTVLHPAFMPSDGVRHAILEKTQGMRTIETNEYDDSPTSLCVLGRSLAVRLAPAPHWLPTIYPTDHGVTRWALSAEAYGEEKQGRAVVTKSTCHAVTLCPVEGDLVGKKTTLHAPIIQMQGPLKQEVQQIGSCWRFRACRELPGRMAVWRAFEITEELDTDVPISEAVVDSVLTGNRLIDLEPEEEHWVDPLEEARRRDGEREERRMAVEERKVSSVLDDLAELQFAFTQPAAAASGSAAWRGHEEQQLVCLNDAPVDASDSSDVLVFAPIDDLLDSDTFAADVFRAPAILPDEHLLLGVPPEEAIKTEQEMLLANPPRTTAVERKWGVYETGDERPDMRVRPKMKKKKKSRSRHDSLASSDDEEERKEEKKVSSSTLDESKEGDSQLHEDDKEDVDSEAQSRERKREAKEDNRLKKHLASINVGFVTSGSDMFDILQGGDESMEAESAVLAAAPEAEAPSPVVAAAAAAPPSPTITFAASGSDLFDLLHGTRDATPPAASDADAPRRAPADDTRARLLGELMKKKEQKPTVQPTAAAATVCDDLLNLTVAPTPALTVATAPAPTQTGPRDERFWAAWSEDPTGAPAPRFAILPYPERPRFEGGWWFRPSRARPEPVESRKDARKKRREAEERWRAEQMMDDADAAPRRPDDTRERLLAEMRMKKAQKAAEPPVAIASVEEQKEVVVEKKEEAAAAPVAVGSRAPADDVRARLLGALMKKKEQKPAQPQLNGSGEEKKDVVFEKKEETIVDVENVLVDLSPSSDSPSPPLVLAAASPAPLLQSPSDLLHDDLKDLF